MGDFINLFLLITAVVALYFQNRAIKISEKELSSKVIDLENIIDKIEKERTERTFQNDQLKSEDVRLLKFIKDLSREESNCRKYTNRLVLHHIENINLSLALSSAYLREIIDKLKIEFIIRKDNQEYNLNVIDDLNTIIKINANSIGFYEITRKFEKELELATENSNARINNIFDNIELYGDQDRQFNDALIAYKVELELALDRHSKAIKG